MPWLGGHLVVTRTVDRHQVAPVAFRLMSEPTPAPGWYPDPSGTGSRYWDGKAWGSSAPTPVPAQSKKWAPTLLIVVAVFAILFAIGIFGYNIGSTSVPPATTSASAPRAAIGQEVRDGNFGFVVTSVDVSKTARDPSIQFEIVPKQGEFVHVHLTVRNIADRPQRFFAYNQTLQIGANQFSSNNEATMWTQAMTVEIKPGTSIQAVVSFDVPRGTTNDGVLTVHGSSSSDGARISLHPSVR